MCITISGYPAGKFPVLLRLVPCGARMLVYDADIAVIKPIWPAHVGDSDVEVQSDAHHYDMMMGMVAPPPHHDSFDCNPKLTDRWFVQTYVNAGAFLLASNERVYRFIEVLWSVIQRVQGWDQGRFNRVLHTPRTCNKGRVAEYPHHSFGIEAIGVLEGMGLSVRIADPDKLTSVLWYVMPTRNHSGIISFHANYCSNKAGCMNEFMRRHRHAK